MDNNVRNKYLLPFTIGMAAVIAVGYYYFVSDFSKEDSTRYIYVDEDDNLDSVEAKLRPIASDHGLWGFNTMARHSRLSEKVPTGRYAVEPSDGAATVFRHIKNGMQAPIKLSVPSVRTTGRMAAELAKQVMADSAQIAKAMSSPETIGKLGFDTATIAAMFIPDTYEVYWNINPEALLGRMKDEYDRFWSGERTGKARKLGLTKVQVSTLASIVDEETANGAEKPMVAGMYYNRLMLRNAEYPGGMPLQADPTVKFAIGDFSIRRIYHGMLSIDSPYNTYRNTGLPPGPIRIPSVQGIDAVLSMVRHDYLYMCAKEDFSGTHNFARTYAEHLQNAAKYSAALNKRGVK